MKKYRVTITQVVDAEDPRKAKALVVANAHTLAVNCSVAELGKSPDRLEYPLVLDNDLYKEASSIMVGVTGQFTTRERDLLIDLCSVQLTTFVNADTDLQCAGQPFRWVEERDVLEKLLHTLDRSEESINAILE